MDGRPDWDTYFLDMCNLAKRRSTCLRRQVGAVIVKSNRVLATGYNGVPVRIDHCSKVGCLRSKMNIPSGQRHEICRGLHAEQNAIIQASKFGVSIDGASIYSSTKPCSICIKMIINANIVRVVYEEDYEDPLTDELIGGTDIRFVLFDRKDNSSDGVLR